MSSMSGPICLWADWATSVGNTEEKSEVCMCVMCVTAAGLVHIATVAHSVTPPNKASTVISICRVRVLFQLVCVCSLILYMYLSYINININIEKEIQRREWDVDEEAGNAHLKSEVIHSVFLIVRYSKVVKQRAGTGECLIPGTCTLNFLDNGR